MKEFYLTVKAMRSAQRNYFNERNPTRKGEYLTDSKRLEKAVDQMIESMIIQGDNVVKIDQKNIFND